MTDVRSVDAPRATYETPMLALLDCVEALRRDGETVFDAALRVLANEALWRTQGRQNEAAQLLGISKRVMNYHAGKYGARPKDRGEPTVIHQFPPAAARGAV